MSPYRSMFLFMTMTMAMSWSWSWLPGPGPGPPLPPPKVKLLAIHMGPDAGHGSGSSYPEYHSARSVVGEGERRMLLRTVRSCTYSSKYCIVFRRYRAEALHVLGTQLICRHARRPQKVLHTTVVQSRLRRVPPPPFSSSHASMTKCYAARAR